MTREEAYADKLISRSELIDKIYDDFESKFTRVEIISASGRVFCDRCDDNSHYVLSIQDDGKTLKLFEVKDKQ